MTRAAGLALLLLSGCGAAAAADDAPPRFVVVYRQHTHPFVSVIRDTKTGWCFVQQSNGHAMTEAPKEVCE